MPPFWLKLMGLLHNLYFLGEKNEKNQKALRPGSFESMVPVSSGPGEEGGGGDINKNDEYL